MTDPTGGGDAARLRKALTGMIAGWYPQASASDGGALLAECMVDGPITTYVDKQIRLAIRAFVVDAANEAATLGRRGPNAVSDWLLDRAASGAATWPEPEDPDA